MPRNRDDEGVGAGGDQQPVIGFDPARPGNNTLRGAVDVGDRIARNQRNAIVRVPGRIVDHDVLERLFAGQHRRKHHPVVIDPRLGPEDRHGVAPRIAGEDFFDRPAPGHAVADHHQPLAQAVRCLVECGWRVHSSSPDLRCKYEKKPPRIDPHRSDTGGFVATRCSIVSQASFGLSGGGRHKACVGLTYVIRAARGKSFLQCSIITAQ